MPALTMDAITTIANRAVVTAMSKVREVGKSLPFDSTYLTADSYGHKLLYPGLLVSFNSDKTKYIPYNENGSYGTYSTYLEGIIHSLMDFTYQTQIVAPATQGIAIEENCYVYGSAVGTIPLAAKGSAVQSLSGVFIQWD
jgi:hypothetical protein